MVQAAKRGKVTGALAVHPQSDLFERLRELSSCLGGLGMGGNPH
jgi:hypothetical protein